MFFSLIFDAVWPLVTLVRRRPLPTLPRSSKRLIVLGSISLAGGCHKSADSRAACLTGSVTHRIGRPTGKACERTRCLASIIRPHSVGRPCDTLTRSSRSGTRDVGRRYVPACLNATRCCVYSYDRFRKSGRELRLLDVTSQVS